MTAPKHYRVIATHDWNRLLWIAAVDAPAGTRAEAIDACEAHRAAVVRDSPELDAMTAERDALLAEVGEAQALRDRLAVVVDENIGVQPVLTGEELLTVLERGMAKQRRDSARELAYEREETRIDTLRGLVEWADAGYPGVDRAKAVAFGPFGILVAFREALQKKLDEAIDRLPQGARDSKAHERGRRMALRGSHRSDLHVLRNRLLDRSDNGTASREEHLLFDLIEQMLAQLDEDEIQDAP